VPEDPKSTRFPLEACATAVREHDGESQHMISPPISHHLVLVSSINTVFQYIQFTPCVQKIQQS